MLPRSQRGQRTTCRPQRAQSNARPKLFTAAVDENRPAPRKIPHDAAHQDRAGHRARKVRRRPGHSCLRRGRRRTVLTGPGAALPQASDGNRLRGSPRTGACSRSGVGTVVAAVDRTEAIADAESSAGWLGCRGRGRKRPRKLPVPSRCSTCVRQVAPKARCRRPTATAPAVGAAPRPATGCMPSLSLPAAQFAPIEHAAGKLRNSFVLFMSGAPRHECLGHECLPGSSGAPQPGSRPQRQASSACRGHSCRRHSCRGPAQPSPAAGFLRPLHVGRKEVRLRRGAREREDAARQGRLPDVEPEAPPQPGHALDEFEQLEGMRHANRFRSGISGHAPSTRIPPGCGASGQNRASSSSRTPC